MKDPDLFDEVRNEMRKMREEFSRILSFGRPLLTGATKELAKYEGARFPLAELKETKDRVIASFEVPGANKEDIELNVDDNSIELKVGKKAEKEIKQKGYYAYEARSKQYYRKLPLPADVKADKAVAVYKDGVLRVEIPKAKKAIAGKKRVLIK